jgi:hypothetical protein
MYIEQELQYELDRLDGEQMQSPHERRMLTTRTLRDLSAFRIAGPRHRCERTDAPKCLGDVYDFVHLNVQVSETVIGCSQLTHIIITLSLSIYIYYDIAYICTACLKH